MVWSRSGAAKVSIAQLDADGAARIALALQDPAPPCSHKAVKMRPSSGAVVHGVQVALEGRFRG